jgi:hypothetical protein
VARRHCLARIAGRHSHLAEARDQIADHCLRRLAGLDRSSPEDALRFVLIVRSAEHPDPVARLAAPRHRDHVVQFEEPGLVAAPAVVRDERATKAIARHRLPAIRVRDGALAATRPRRPRPLCLAESLPLELVEEPIEHAIEHLGEISRRHLVAKERLRPQELVASGRADGQLERESLVRERRHPGWDQRYWFQNHLAA